MAKKSAPILGPVSTNSALRTLHTRVFNRSARVRWNGPAPWSQEQEVPSGVSKHCWNISWINVSTITDFVQKFLPENIWDEWIKSSAKIIHQCTLPCERFSLNFWFLEPVGVTSPRRFPLVPLHYGRVNVCRHCKAMCNFLVVWFYNMYIKNWIQVEKAKMENTSSYCIYLYPIVYRIYLFYINNYVDIHQEF